MGCSLLIKAEKDFSEIDTVPLNFLNSQPTHGFLSFKFILEMDDRVNVAFDIQDRILHAEQRIKNDKIQRLRMC